MNSAYRSLWNDSTGTFVAVPENASSAGKKTSSGVKAIGLDARFVLQALAVSVMLAFGTNALAQPTGGVVASGAATISTGATSTTITQSTSNAIINWQSFNIAAGQSVQFVQPTSSSITLNRVVGADPSSILGSLSANGKVFLINPNGILFGQGASVNVGGLVASTLNMTDADFNAGNYKFSGNGRGSVLNQGNINADGGYVALLGANVSNQGTISAQLGSVVLAAGSVMTMDVAGDGLFNIAVTEGAVNALVENGGLIRADGGQVLLTTQAAGSLLANSVNNTGVIQAQTLVTGKTGSIMLMGGMETGTVNVGGTLDASAPNGGNGGFIETSAAYVKIVDGTKVTTLASAGTTGTWLIDPMDYTVAALGGDITGSLLGTNLDSTSVTIQSTAGTAGTLGNVNVNDAVTWTAATTLRMEAVNDVNINQAITGTSGSVVAVAGHDVNVAAATKTTTGMLSFTAVNDVTISAATTITTGNLTAVAGGNVTVSAASTVSTGNMVFIADNDGTGPGAAAGTVAITCGSNCLTITTGTLSIRFNPVSYATTDAEITAYDANLTGAGVLDAKAWVFGLGDNKMYDGTTAATVSGLKSDTLNALPPVALGAVSGANFDSKHVGTSKPIIYTTIFDDPAYALFAPTTSALGTYLARGNIAARPLTVNAVTDTRVYNGTTSSVGVPTVIDLQTGDTLNGPLTQAYASKDVMGSLVSTLVATGPYTVTDGNGGNNYTVTVNTAPGTITPLALVGSITANNKMYDANNSAVISSRTLATAFAGDEVSYVGGIALFSDENVANGKSVTGIDLSLTGADAGNYTVNSTAITTANITPAPLTITANNAVKVYGQTLVLADSAFNPTGLVNGETVGSVTESSTGTVATAPVAGSPYDITPSAATGGTFTPGNYSITYVDGTLTITPAPLTIAANDASKVYGQTTTLAPTDFTTSALVNGETVGSVTEVSTGTVATAPVAGSPYDITPSAASGGTFTPGNYSITYVDGTLIVTPAPLTITANDASKVYGQTLVLAPTAFNPTGLVNGETVGSVTEVSTGTVATAPVADSTYGITPSAATGGTFTPGNYTIAYVNGALTVTPAPLTLTANDATKIYGTTFTPAGTAFTQTGLVNSDTVTSVAETTTGSPPTASVAGSPYSVVITPGSAAGSFTATNYTISYVNGALTVTPAPLTITANDAAKVYGETLVLADTAFNHTGLVNGETVGSVTEVSTGTVATAPVADNPYGITPSAATGGTFTPGNYSITYVDSTLTITPAPLIITADDASKVYGTTFTPAGTAFTQTGLVNSDTVTSVAETTTGSPPTASVAGSPYSVVITPGSAAGSFTATNYSISYVDGKLTITPAPLTITANDASKVYGETLVLADTDFTVTGLVNDDTVTSVLETSAGTLATAPATDSPYAISPGTASGTYDANNYNVIYVDGKLYILPVVVPPVDVPTVDTPPSEVPLSDTPDEEVLPDSPVELPTVKLPVGPVVLPPVVVTPLIPPQLQTVTFPVLPVRVAAPNPVVVAPRPERIEPMIQTEPPRYAAPIRPRKQDRN